MNHADNIKRLATEYAAAVGRLDFKRSEGTQAVLHTTIDAREAEFSELQAERDMYKATAEAIVCMHCDTKHQAQAAEIARLREALKTISRTEYHITRPPIFSLDEQMRQIARKALEQTK